MTTLQTNWTLSKGQLHRSISWVGAFWVASGVPALVLFSIGGIAGTAGNLAFLDLGRIDRAGVRSILHLRGNRRALSQQIGGASIYGAAAWVRYVNLSRRCPCGATGSPGAPSSRSAAPLRRPMS